MKYFKNKCKIRFFFLFGYIKREKENKIKKIRKQLSKVLIFTIKTYAVNSLILC